jgi:cytidylate kinase
MNEVPIITVDGPTASGKGTVASRVAAALGFHYLDSGALYRLVALQALEGGVDLTDGDRLARLAAALDPQFATDSVRLAGREVTDAIRTEPVSQAASRIAVYPQVRAALLALQRGSARPPGLVADGRDMGTVVFPAAGLKVFLVASVEERAARRYKQLIDKGFSANLAALLQDLRVRDERDATRSTSPLVPAQGARQLDSTGMTVDAVVAQVLSWYRGS